MKSQGGEYLEDPSTLGKTLGSAQSQTRKELKDPGSHQEDSKRQARSAEYRCPCQTGWPRCEHDVTGQVDSDAKFQSEICVEIGAATEHDEKVRRTHGGNDTCVTIPLREPKKSRQKNNRSKEDRIVCV